MFTDEPAISLLPVNPISQSSNSTLPAKGRSSSLDAQSTSAHDAIPSFYRSWAIKPFQKEYDAVYETYDSLLKPKILERLEACRTFGTFVRHKETGKVRVSSTSCHVRGCPMCAAARAKRIAASTSEYLADEPDAKFMTLTMAHSADPLQEQIKTLTRYFRAFRRLKPISTKVRGGFWFLEMKLGKDDQWHIHLHCLVVSSWIAQKQLSELWENVTGKSYIVDIRKIKDARTAADYAAKYASNPAELRFLPMSYRQQMIEATRNVRTYGTWGVV